MDGLVDQISEFARKSGRFPAGSSMFFKPVGELPESRDASRWSDQDWLSVGRALMAAYEAEFVFLPDDATKFCYRDWQEQYDEERLFASHLTRHRFERDYFAEFHSATEISGSWDEEGVRAFLDSYFETLNGEGSEVLARRVLDFPDPQLATDFLAIQFAADFLVESSAMIRNVQGYFGPQQSELFKIIIDEFGYGVHETKHSTLYKDLLESIGLPSVPHHFFSWYLPTTLLMNNYYNKISSNHKYFFYFIGAITQFENSFVVSFPALQKVFDEVYEGKARTNYFREHVHIDQHHGRMAVNDLFLSLIRQYGVSIIPDLLRGFEESILLDRRQGAEFGRYLDALERLVAAGYRQGDADWRVQATAPTTLFGALRGTSAATGDGSLIVAPGLRVPVATLEGLGDLASGLLVRMADDDRHA